MAPVTFHLIQVPDQSAFIAALRKLPDQQRPIYVGECQHWVHEPKLSTAALLGDGSQLQRWGYLLVHKATAPGSLDLLPALTRHIRHSWSMATDVANEMLASYPTVHAKRLATTPPPLPSNWSASDHTGLDASKPPPDLEASLGLTSYPLGSDKNTTHPMVLKDFVRSFGTANPHRPVQMMNFLSCNLGQRPRLFQYIAAFAASVGIKYGGEAAIWGPVIDWSTRELEGELTAEEADRVGKAPGFETGALVWYPSLWHFGKMLDDPAYAEADRMYKVGALRDGALLCCTEVEVGYPQE